jgi:UDP-N-acetylmuramoyl-L-alanyl-D-glutamate--2,6-diaminopimelate ligase
MMAASREQGRPLLSTLLQGIAVVEPALERPVAALSLDSRNLAPGTLFCALSGTRRHGMEFVSGAAQGGAVAVLAEPGADWSAERIRQSAPDLGIPAIPVPELSQRLSTLAGRFFGEPSRGLDLIAATGTNGKTSVCQFIAQALAGERPCGVVGTLGYGFPGELAPTAHTTPDAIRLQAILAELRERGAGAVAMEVSSHALDQGRAAGVAVDTAVFTNLTRDHLDYNQDMLDYARAKRRLFHLPGLRHAVLNADDPFGLEILASLDPAVQPVLYGLNRDWRPAADATRWLRADRVEPRARGMQITVCGSWGEGAFSTALLGHFNAGNLLAVLAVLLLRGWELESALARIGQVSGVPGRMECFGAPDQPLVVVDYAHTPDALEQALSVLREHRPRRLIALFGCGGDRDRGKRPLMGAVAERLGDRVIVTDDNPRGEDGDHIIDDILAGMQAPQRAQVQRHRGRAIRDAVCGAVPDDIVLVAGKGHETTQTVGDLVLPFSDREQVAEALSGRGGCGA